MIPRNQSGFTLMEIIVALFLIAIGVVATAPLFVYASQENAIGGDLGHVGAVAVRQMERLRATNYYALANGGDLDSDVNNYFDDSDADVLVRWTVADHTGGPADTKLITVRALAVRQLIGAAKRAELISVRSK